MARLPRSSGVAGLLAAAEFIIAAQCSRPACGRSPKLAGSDTVLCQSIVYGAVDNQNNLLHTTKYLTKKIKC